MHRATAARELLEQFDLDPSLRTARIKAAASGNAKALRDIVPLVADTFEDDDLTAEQARSMARKAARSATYTDDDYAALVTLRSCMSRLVEAHRARNNALALERLVAHRLIDCPDSLYDTLGKLSMHLVADLYDTTDRMREAAIVICGILDSTQSHHPSERATLAVEALRRDGLLPC